MKAKAIIYLSYDGMTDPLGQSQVVPYLIALSQKGYRFHLISFEKEERYESGKAKMASLLEQAGIRWHPCVYTKSPPVLSTIKDLRVMKRRALKIMEEEEIVLLHCRSYISALAGLSFHRRFKIPFLFDMRGFWADERVDGKIWNLKQPVFHFIYRYFKKKEKEFLLESAHIISLTQAAKDEILSWNLPGLLPGKITVIPCCADLDFFDPEKVLIERLKKRQEDLKISPLNKVMIYLGSLGTWYMAEEMVLMFSFLLREDPGMVFLVVTKDEPEKINFWARKYQIPSGSLRFFSAEREDVPELIAMSHLSVFFILPSYSKKASSPTKLAELMAMGKPVICNSGVGDVAQIVSHAQAGWVLNSFSVTEMQHLAKTIVKSLPEVASAPLRKAGYEYGSLSKGSSLYAGVYEQLIGR